MSHRGVLRSWRSVLGACLGLVLATCSPGSGGGPRYALLRETEVQPVPGSLEYVLQPPPEDFDPAIGPRAAAGRVPGIGGGEVQVILAMLGDTLRGGELGPAWVVLARGVCVRSGKGELVSNARGTNPDALTCDDRSILMVAVDARSGKTLRYVAGYDSTRTWRPAVGAPGG